MAILRAMWRERIFVCRWMLGPPSRRGQSPGVSWQHSPRASLCRRAHRHVSGRPWTCGAKGCLQGVGQQGLRVARSPVTRRFPRNTEPLGCRGFGLTTLGASGAPILATADVRGLELIVAIAAGGAYDRPARGLLRPYSVGFPDRTSGRGLWTRHGLRPNLPCMASKMSDGIPHLGRVWRVQVCPIA